MSNISTLLAKFWKLLITKINPDSPTVTAFHKKPLLQLLIYPDLNPKLDASIPQTFISNYCTVRIFAPIRLTTSTVHLFTRKLYVRIQKLVSSNESTVILSSLSRAQSINICLLKCYGPLPSTYSKSRLHWHLEKNIPLATSCTTNSLFSLHTPTMALFNAYNEKGHTNRTLPIIFHLSFKFTDRQTPLTSTPSPS